jgi:hypothetical protein
MVAIRLAVRPAASDICAPKMVLDSVSLPRLSVPKRWELLGLSRTLPAKTLASNGAIKGATAAMMMNPTIRMPPMAPKGFLLQMYQKCASFVPNVSSRLRSSKMTEDGSASVLLTFATALSLAS